MSRKIYTMLMIVALITLAVALPDNANTKIDFTYKSPATNYSLVNVNNSQFLGGYNSSQFVKRDVVGEPNRETLSGNYYVNGQWLPSSISNADKLGGYIGSDLYEWSELYSAVAYIGSSGVKSAGNVYPSTPASKDLGTKALLWRNLWLSGNLTSNGINSSFAFLNNITLKENLCNSSGTCYTLDDLNASTQGVAPWLYNSGNTINFNESKLSTQYFNATINFTIRGTPSGRIEDNQVYDDKSYNVTEVAGANGLDFRLNFTGITSFNQLIFRYKSTAGESHNMNVQIYDYTEGAWQNYATLGEVLDYNVKEIGVYDKNEHIGTGGEAGVVQLRFYQAANGNTAHKHQFDWIALADGYATPSGAEVDPYSWHRDSAGEAGNYTTSGNVTAGMYYLNTIGNNPCPISSGVFCRNATGTYIGG